MTFKCILHNLKQIPIEKSPYCEMSSSGFKSKHSRGPGNYVDYLWIMVPKGIAAVLRAPNQLCYFVHFFSLFVTYFVHNVVAVISYDWKELLDIRTATTHLELDEDIFFNESDTKDILLPRDQALIPVIRVKERRKYRGRRSG